MHRLNFKYDVNNSLLIHYSFVYYYPYILFSLASCPQEDTEYTTTSKALELVPKNHNHDQKRLLAAESSYPNWLADFKFSYNGRPGGYDCVQIEEPSERGYWDDNFFCWKQGTKDPGFKWSYQNSIPGMRCTQIEEPSDSGIWDDNYLCVPMSSPYQFYWSYRGTISGKNCMLWNEPSDGNYWDDNYLCADQGCPIIDNIPASHATPGFITYDKQPLSSNGVYPAGTKATFRCAYNPFWFHSDKATCQRLTGWDKDPNQECARNEDGQGFLLLPPSFDMCPYSMYLSKEDCRQAGLAVGGFLLDGKVKEGSWSWLPFGCSINQSSGNIHYNSSRGDNNGHYQPVCSKGSFTSLPETFEGGCPSSMNVSKGNCAAIGLSAGGKLHNEKVIEGSWGHVPYGCSIKEEDSEILYNSKSNGENNGSYASLCHKLPVSDFDSSLLYFF